MYKITALFPSYLVFELKFRITFLSIFVCTFLLSGCGESETQIIYIEVPSYVPEIEEEIPEVALADYTIKASKRVNALPIEREYTYAFTLDSVNIEYVPNSDTFTIINNTPRYFDNPTLIIDNKYYKLETSIDPFQYQTFDVSDLNATVIKFYDEQPFFKIKNNGYLDHLNSDEVGLASADNALQYEFEMRAYKNVMNDMDFIVHSAEYLTDYGKTSTRTLTEMNFEDIDCPHPSHSRTGTDTSPSYTKILSMLMHQPTSIHYLLLKSYNGLATIGNGWLSVRDFRLYQNGQTVPKTTYLHEKMHNHGFGHAGGLTYGIPDVLINYIKKGYFSSDYYDAKKLSQTIPKAVADLTVESVDTEYLDLVVSFWTENDNVLKSTPSVKRFFLVFPASVEFSKAYTDLDNSLKTAQPSLSLAENKALMFDLNDGIQVRQFGEQDLGTKSDELRIRIKRPSTTQTFVFMATGAPAEWALQANIHVKITAEHGLLTDDNQVVYITPDEYHGEDGLLVSTQKLYTPDEAITLCETKGLTLGKLKTFRSQAQIDFQMKYLQYQSQVGIDPDTLQAVAVDVSSSYRPEYVNYSEKGALVVCE